MKKYFLAIAFSLGAIISAQNYELTTLRIGDYTINQDRNSVEKMSKTKMNPNADYQNPNKINYHGETIAISMYDKYYEDGKSSVNSVYFLTTKSKKFRTKSGLGIGSTRAELIEAYKNFPNFTVHQYIDESNPISARESFFTLNDNDANTYLVFKMLDNVVSEITVSINEGC